MEEKKKFHDVLARSLVRFFSSCQKSCENDIVWESFLISW